MPRHERNKSAKRANVVVDTAEVRPVRQREPTAAQLRRRGKNTANKKRIKKERAVERVLGRVLVTDSPDIKTIWLRREEGHTDEMMRRTYGNKFAWPRGFESFIDDWPAEGDDPNRTGHTPPYDHTAVA